MVEKNAGSDALVERLREYTRGAEMILSNAESLSTEAAVLKKAGFRPRAAFLHQISMEECAKIDMLGAWATTRLMGGEVDDDVIARVFRDHKAKNHANAYNAIPTPEESAARESGDCKSASEAFKAFQRNFHSQVNTVKNSALYVDFSDGRFESPAELIGEEPVTVMAALNADFLSRSALFVRLLRRMANETNSYREWVQQFVRRAVELHGNNADPQQMTEQLLDEMRKTYR